MRAALVVALVWTTATMAVASASATSRTLQRQPGAVRGRKLVQQQRLRRARTRGQPVRVVDGVRLRSWLRGYTTDVSPVAAARRGVLGRHVVSRRRSVLQHDDTAVYSGRSPGRRVLHGSALLELLRLRSGDDAVRARRRGRRSVHVQLGLLRLRDVLQGGPVRPARGDRRHVRRRRRVRGPVLWTRGDVPRTTDVPVS